VRFIGGGQYRAAAAPNPVWKGGRDLRWTGHANRPETRVFHRGPQPEEEISTAVDEAVEYFGKGL
jgi:hypothetical protein